MTSVKGLKKVFTAKDFLFTLDTFFAEPEKTVPEEEKRKVWDILTALRGPDDDNHYLLKWATTAIIRARVFVRGRKRVGKWATINSEKMVIDLTRFTPQPHFHYHVLQAAKALGIEVKERSGEERRDED